MSMNTEAPESMVSKIACLNVFSLNVHGWLDHGCSQMIDKSVCRLVKNLQPDICCFQEVKRPLETLSSIAEAMKAKTDNIHYTPSDCSIFGNAVIFKPNGIVEDKKLAVYMREIRAATKVMVETGYKWDLAIINLHLDHQREEVRIKQIEVLFEWLNCEDNVMSSLPHLIVGDFNAVSYWTPEVVEARKMCNLQPSTKDLYQLLTETHRYVDLETVHPPRNTSVYNVRVDYIFCSPALAPRIRRDRTLFRVIDSDSDHSAILGNIEFNVSKLLIGIVSEEGKNYADDLKEMLIMKGIGDDIEIIKDDFSQVFDKLQLMETIIVEGSNVHSLLPSLDFLFNVQSENPMKENLPVESSKQLIVSSIEEMVSHIENYM